MREREQWTPQHRSEVKTITGGLVLLLGSALLYFGSGAIVTGMGAGIATMGLMQMFPKMQTWALPLISEVVRRLPFLSDPLPDRPKDETEV